jgi:hypothetical protein
MDILGPEPENEARPWTTCSSDGALPVTTEQKDFVTAIVVSILISSVSVHLRSSTFGAIQ